MLSDVEKWFLNLGRAIVLTGAEKRWLNVENVRQLSASEGAPLSSAEVEARLLQILNGQDKRTFAHYQLTHKRGLFYFYLSRPECWV